MAWVSGMVSWPGVLGRLPVVGGPATGGGLWDDWLWLGAGLAVWGCQLCGDIMIAPLLTIWRGRPGTENHKHDGGMGWMAHHPLP